MCKTKKLWLHKRSTAHHGKTKTMRKKHGNSDDPQIFRPDLRLPAEKFFFPSNARWLSPAEKTAKETQNGAGATPNKNQIHGLQTRWGQAHRVSEICTNELIGGEKQNNSQQHGSEKLMYNGSHLRRSGVLCLSSNKLTSCKGSGLLPQSMGVQSVSGHRNVRARLALEFDRCAQIQAGRQTDIHGSR